MTAAELSVPRKFRVAVKNRTTLRQQIDQLLCWNPERLLIAHGPVIDNNAAKVLRRAFAWAKP